MKEEEVNKVLAFARKRLVTWKDMTKPRNLLPSTIGTTGYCSFLYILLKAQAITVETPTTLIILVAVGFVVIGSFTLVSAIISNIVVYLLESKKLAIQEDDASIKNTNILITEIKAQFNSTLLVLQEDFRRRIEHWEGRERLVKEEKDKIVAECGEWKIRESLMKREIERAGYMFTDDIKLLKVAGKQDTDMIR